MPNAFRRLTLASMSALLLSLPGCAPRVVSDLCLTTDFTDFASTTAAKVWACQCDPALVRRLELRCK